MHSTLRNKESQENNELQTMLLSSQTYAEINQHSKESRNKNNIKLSPSFTSPTLWRTSSNNIDINTITAHTEATAHVGVSSSCLCDSPAFAMVLPPDRELPPTFSPKHTYRIGQSFHIFGGEVGGFWEGKMGTLMGRVRGGGEMGTKIGRKVRSAMAANGMRSFRARRRAAMAAPHVFPPKF